MHLPAHLPSPLRAAVGLVATAADEAKHLPDRAIELPMLAVSTALQLSLRAQQRYALLTVRGDEALSRRAPSDEPPAWATFDEDLPNDGDLPDTPPAGETSVTATTKPGEKGVSAPRHTNPSRFDVVGDE